MAAGFLASAQAAGTAAGTDINNSATLTYSVGGTAQSSICSAPGGNNTSTCTPTTFKVDNKINLLVTTNNNTAVSAVPGGTHTLTFVVTNSGNSTQDIVLSTTQVATSGTVLLGGGGGTTYTDSFDASSCTITDTANAPLPVGPLANTYRITNVAPDGTSTVYASCTIPTTKAGGVALVNTDASVVSLKAVAYIAAGGAIAVESNTNTSTVVDTVFADGAGSDDAARGGDYSARSAYRIQTAALTVAKIFKTLCDPAGGAIDAGYAPKSIPGAYIQYTVSIANSNTAPVSAILTNLSDTLDTTKVTFDTELITGANVASAPACAATTAPTGAGAATSAGNYVKLELSGGTRASFPGGVKFINAVYTTPTLTIPWATMLPAESSHVVGELLPGETISATYNVIIK
ncbi:hypothetical protein [Ramlibacter algicola]|uniref:DUF11 domain-containing protein n=1 Tax=Ramlibacter algicola TaxID=2795217 RepID=A0A934UQ06_9BURK|nr:hypothetical protein [Ramlibacter algicola]MBK0391630.1 hypothetical protein [Ramlibacter algicola]